MNQNRANRTGALFAMGMASSLALPNGNGIWTTLFALMGLALLVSRAFRTNRPLPKEISSTLKYLLPVVAVGIGAPIAIDLLHGNELSLDQSLTLLLFPAISVVIYRLGPDPEFFFIGASLAAIAATILAVYQHYFMGVPRASGFVNAIVFGDLCVLFGLTCLIRATSYLVSKKRLSFFFIVGAISGFYASLLSGSKGGWLVLLLGLVVGLVRIQRMLGYGKRIIALGVISCLAILATVTPNNSVSRIETGISGAITWIETGKVTDGSVSTRLELWHAGVMTFLESPLYGMGFDDQQSFKHQLITDGKSEEVIVHFRSFHNEFIASAADMGVIGLLFSIASFVLPFLVFRRLYGHQIHAVRDLATVGMLLPVAFAEFGLSISIWGRSDFRFVYVAWIVILLALMARTIVEKHSNHDEISS